MAHTGYTQRLNFCDANTINHYFCDIHPLLQLSCTSTQSISWLFSLWWTSTSLCPVSPSLSLWSYFFQHLPHQLHRGQVQSLQHVQFTRLCCFSLLWIGVFMYLKPPSAVSVDEGKISSVFYTNMIPMMNPLINSLRNKYVKTYSEKNPK